MLPESSTWDRTQSPDGADTLARKTVFIVEDNPIISEIIAFSINKLGYSVCDSVQTGEEAIRYCGKCRPDLVIMDISLKGEMDGIEAGALIKNQFSIPVVFLTGYSMMELPERVRDAQPDGFISKPFSDDDIRRVIGPLL